MSAATTAALPALTTASAAERAILRSLAKRIDKLADEAIDAGIDAESSIAYQRRHARPVTADDLRGIGELIDFRANRVTDALDALDGITADLAADPATSPTAADAATVLRGAIEDVRKLLARHARPDLRARFRAAG